MQLSFSFSALLAGVLVALSVNEVQAVPAQRRMVTLPLARMEARGDGNLHPQILHQQHVNRAVRRLARMTGKREPSDEELLGALHKRVLEVEGQEGLERRFNRWATTVKEKRYNRWATTVKERRKNRFDVTDAAAGDETGAATDGSSTDSSAASSANSSVSADAAPSALGGPDSATGIEVANPPTGKNSLGLNIEAKDVGYLATIQMGTPPRPFLILMDSGSADLWVASEQCQDVTGGNCGNHQKLGSQSSSSFQASNTPFKVTYGTGAVAGQIIKDNINVAGLALNGHTFGVATQETQDFSADTVPFDGLMGLAQSTLSQQRVPTPPESLASAGLISDAIVSYKISRAADNKNDGEITFGGLDPAKFDAQTLVTIPNVSKQGFWAGDMDAITVDGQDLGLKGRDAILDTGTTLIVAPPPDAAAVHQQIQGAQQISDSQFSIPCDTTQKVALTFGGTSFEIDPRDLAFQPLQNGQCLSGISAGNFGTSNTEWLVGDVFLKNAYFSHDVGKNQISLAKLV